MELIKIFKDSFNKDTNTLTIKIQVKDVKSAVKNTPSSVFDHIYLDNQDTWASTNVHTTDKGSDDLVDLVNPAASSIIQVGDYTQYTLILQLTEDNHNLGQFKDSDFLICTVEVKESAIDVITVATGECSDLICKQALYNILNVRLSLLDSAKELLKENLCELPKCFIHTLLMIDSLDLFAKCGLLYKAALTFIKLNKQANKTNTTKSCNCHGN